MKFKIVLLAFVLLFFGCGDDDPVQVGTELPNFTKPIKGYVQKGPFINGTAITISELSKKLSPTGSNFQTKIVDNKGSFEVREPSLVSPYVSLRADGYYFNEITGVKSTAPITLYALSDITNRSTVNVNLLSHLENSRVDYLVGTKVGFDVAKKQAAKEILSIFSITDSISFSENLDISQAADENAILLAISVMLLGNQSEGDFTEFLSNISTDIREDGVLDSDILFNKILANAKALDLPSIRTNLEKRYSELGVAATIGDFEKYILNFINSSKTEKPLITTITPNGGSLNGLSQNFTASVITPFNSNITKYKFDFDGDGVWDVEKDVDTNLIVISETFTYPDYKEYTYSFYVEDNYGNSSEVSYDITISNVEAVISGLLDKDITIGDVVNFDISLSEDDSIKMVIVDFGEGDVNRPQYDTIYGSSDFTVSHEYTSTINSDSVVFPLVVSSIDKFGTESKVSKLITVHQGVPEISVISPKGNCHGLEQTFNVNFKDLYGGVLTNYKIDFDNDGVWDVEENVSDSHVTINENYTYPTPSTSYTYRVFVKDDDNNSTMVVDSFYIDNIEWERCYGSANNELVYSLQQTTDGGYIVSGGSYIPYGNTRDIWIFKLDSLGTLLWETYFSGKEYTNSFKIQEHMMNDPII